MKVKKNTDGVTILTGKASFDMPLDLYGELQEAANVHRTTVLELVIKFMKVGLLIFYATRHADHPATFILRTKYGEREVTLD